MENYTSIQKLLHKIALSPKFMREFAFDLEKSLFLEDTETSGGKHVFIAGLARSGSTAILNAIFESDEFASLSYADMPFILAPNFWKRISSRLRHDDPIERSHGDGIEVATNSPEAFEEVFWKTFGLEGNQNEEFNNFVRLILRKNGAERYLSKNNQNIRRIRQIVEIFPNSKVILPFRSPVYQSYSLFKQHSKFMELQLKDRFVRNYMTWIGHSEFGSDYLPVVSHGLEYEDTFTPDHWLEQWLLVYGAASELALRNKQIHLVCYETMCQKIDVWKSMQELLDFSHRSKCPFTCRNQLPPVEYNRELVIKCEALYQEMKSRSLPFRNS